MATTPRSNIAQQYQHSDVWNQPWAQEANPYSGYQGNVQGLIDKLGANVFGPGGLGSGGGTGSSSWGMNVANPNDPAVADYMSHNLQAQRGATDELVKIGQTAGVNRGGTNVAGGPQLGTGLWGDAIGKLASMGGQRFQDAMAYNKYATGQANDNQRYMLGQYNSALGNQLAGDQASAGWTAARTNRRMDDWQYDQNKAYDQFNNAGATARSNQQANDQLNQGQWAAGNQQRNQGLLQQAMYSRPDPGANPWLTSTHNYLMSNGTIPSKAYR